MKFYKNDDKTFFVILAVGLACMTFLYRCATYDVAKICADQCAMNDKELSGYKRNTLGAECYCVDKEKPLKQPRFP